MDGNGKMDLRGIGCEDGNRSNQFRIVSSGKLWY
jgi:hypothetical protein